ncbi:MAG: hypothetical protein LUE27_02180 [Clostridia bacterium]|nr:hypothetical protein [Clostridia bacterium]
MKGIRLNSTVIVGDESCYKLQAVSSPAFNRKKHDAVFAKIMNEAAGMAAYDLYVIRVNIEESETGIGCICTALSDKFSKMYMYDVVVVTEPDDPYEDSKAYITTMSREKMQETFSLVCNEDRLPEDLDAWRDFSDVYFSGDDDDDEDKKTEEEKRASRIIRHKGFAYTEEDFFPAYWSLARDKYMDTYSITISNSIMDPLWSHGRYETILRIFRQYQADPVYAYYAAEVLFNGFTGEPDYAKAFEYYRFAVYRGEVRAYCRLAIMYRDGLGVKKDYNEYKRLLLEGYNKVLECGKQYLPVIADTMLELSRAGQACGNAKDALKAISLIADSNENAWIHGAGVSKTDVKCMEQMYSLKPFAKSKRRLADFLYILQKPCKVRFTIRGKKHTAEALESGGEVIVAYEGQYYKDPVQFINRAEIDEKPVKSYVKELQRMEVVV